MILKISWAVIFMTAFFIGNSQNIEGKVVSEKGIPIPNVSVSTNNSKITQTDAQGIFILPENYQLPIEITLKHPEYETENFMLTEGFQNLLTLTKNTVPEILGLVVVSTKPNKQSQVLAPTDNITSEALEQFSPVDVVSAINQVPGVYIQNGAINTNRITIRGVGSRTLFGTNKIRAYFNGIPITNGVGETTLDSYNPEDLAQLEIVKGPKATLYGTNLGGTLLLRSKTPQEEGIELSNTTTLGSYGLFKNSISTSVKEKKLSLHFNYDHLELDGYRENSTYNRNTYLLTGAYALNPNHELSFLLNHTNDFAQIASSISRSDFEEDPTQAAFTWGQARGFEDNRQTLAGFQYAGNITKTLSNTTSVYYSYLDHYEPRPFNILDEITNGYGARTVFTKELTVADKRTSVSAGSEFFQDSYRWETLENLYEENNGNGSLAGDLLSKNKEVRTQLNIFASGQIALSEALEIQVGANVNNTSYTYTDLFNESVANTSGDRDFELLFAPSATLSYQIAPDKYLFANVSRGFNYPSLEETLTPNGIINPDIGPETGWNYELGTQLQFFEKSLSLNAAAYLLVIDDLVVAERVGDDQFIGRNAGETHHRGIELGLTHDYRFLQNYSLRSYLTSEFNFHKFIDFVDGAEDFSGNDLTGVPDVKISTGIKLQHDSGWYVLSNFQYIGSQPITDANTLYSDSYELVNAKAGYTYALTNSLVLKADAGINNVFNKQYASSILINASSFGGNEPRYFYPGLPRNYYGSFSVRYSF